jgi:hypothetical protein
MKVFLKVLAWLGAGFLLLLIAANFTQSIFAITAETVGGLMISPESAFVFSLIGIIPMLIGGITGKPRYFWLACIATGSLYILSHFYFYTLLSYWIEQGYIYTLFRELMFMILPGLVAIIEGIWLKRKAVIPAGRQVFYGNV